jgi:hypothetical protein
MTKKHTLYGSRGAGSAAIEVVSSATGAHDG